MSDFPEYDEIHVISDIHMGGAPGFQILKETKRLANFIRWVAQQRPDQRVALILNGDIIDTLAENIAGYIAIDDAVSTVQRIMNDSSFSQVWDALADFVKRDRRTLVIVIGNHDIEMSLPVVQRQVLSRLTGGDAMARSRIEFSTMGAGYSCVVGSARIYCIHGNEVDGWNLVRYEDLAKVARRMNAGQTLTVKEWEPNAGTKMVKDVMNAVKHRYAWIDLLKPETQAAVGALLVLDPGQVSAMNRILPVLGETFKALREVDKRLSGDQVEEPASTSAPATIEQLLGPNLTEAMSGGRTEDEMLLAAEEGYAMAATATAGTTQGTLGTGQVLFDRFTGWITGVTKDEALRRALKDWLKGDKTFDITEEDDTYRGVTKSVGPAIDFVVTGHTHLERAIDMGGGRYYFNCGTWIRLLRLTDTILRDTASFKPIYEVLINGTMKAIDDARVGPNSQPFVMDQSTAVSISSEGGRVVGRLTHVVGDGTGRPQEIKSFTRP